MCRTKEERIPGVVDHEGNQSRDWGDAQGIDPLRMLREMCAEGITDDAEGASLYHGVPDECRIEGDWPNKGGNPIWHVLLRFLSSATMQSSGTHKPVPLFQKTLGTWFVVDWVCGTGMAH